MKLLTMMALGAMAIGCDDSAQKGEPGEPDAQLESTPDEVAAETTAETSPPEEVAAETSATETVAETSPETSEPETTADVIEPDTTEARPRLSYKIEPITVQSGKERQVCKTINVPSDGSFDIVRFSSRMVGISHHFNLYKVIDDTAFNPVTTDESTVHDCSPAAEQLRGDAAYIFGSASDRVMETPPGVAFNLKPGQRLILEYHAINYTTETIEAALEIDLEGPLPGEVIEHHADIIWFANWGFFLPPGQETSDTTSCAVPYDVEIFGLMSHFHELGTNFTIEAIKAGEAAQVYEDDDWAHPKYQSFAPTLSLAAGDKIRWTCTWNNTRDTLVLPNKGSKDEMCMVFAAAYPKAGLSGDPIQCNKF